MKYSFYFIGEVIYLEKGYESVDVAIEELRNIADIFLRKEDSEGEGYVSSSEGIVKTYTYKRKDGKLEEELK